MWVSFSPGAVNDCSQSELRQEVELVHFLDPELSLKMFKNELRTVSEAEFRGKTVCTAIMGWLMSAQTAAGHLPVMWSELYLWWGELAILVSTKLPS